MKLRYSDSGGPTGAIILARSHSEPLLTERQDNDDARTVQRGLMSQMERQAGQAPIPMPNASAKARSLVFFLSQIWIFSNSLSVGWSLLRSWGRVVRLEARAAILQVVGDARGPKPVAANIEVG